MADSNEDAAVEQPKDEAEEDSPTLQSEDPEEPGIAAPLMPPTTTHWVLAPLSDMTEVTEPPESIVDTERGHSFLEDGQESERLGMSLTSSHMKHISDGILPESSSSQDDGTQSSSKDAETVLEETETESQMREKDTEHENINQDTVGDATEENQQHPLDADKNTADSAESPHTNTGIPYDDALKENSNVTHGETDADPPVSEQDHLHDPTANRPAQEMDHEEDVIKHDPVSSGDQLENHGTDRPVSEADPLHTAPGDGKDLHQEGSGNDAAEFTEDPLISEEGPVTEGSVLETQVTEHLPNSEGSATQAVVTETPATAEGTLPTVVTPGVGLDNVEDEDKTPERTLSVGGASSGDSQKGVRAQKGILKSASSSRDEIPSALDTAELNRRTSQLSRLDSQHNSGLDSNFFPSRLDTATHSDLQLVSPNNKKDFYIDAHGNVKEISSEVNVHQFFPELPLPGARSFVDEGTEKSDAGSRKTGSSKHPSRAHSAAKTVHFDESGPQVTELDDEESEMYEDESGDGDTMSYTETVDSISLPATSPAPSREATSADLFPTQVDEETLEAAKVRQRRRTIILEPEKLEAASPAQPTMADLLDARARQHFEDALTAKLRSNYQSIIMCINKALNLRPNNIQYYVERAEAYLGLCDFQSAILNYKRVCVLAPNNTSYYSRLAFIYFFQGQCLFDQKLYPEALEAFSRAAEMRPEVIGYHTRSIACLAALKRHGECLALVNKRLETEETSADLYVMRARLHELFRNTTLCYYDVKDALSLDPTHQEAIVLMQNLETKAEDLKQQATQLNLVHRHRDALQKISVAIETNPSVPEYHILRGALQRRLCDFNAAIDDYLLALDKTDHREDSPVYLEAQRQLLLTYNDFAVECFTKGFYEEAVILLNKALKGEKREKGLYINRGDCFFQQNNLQFALADYHQALELDLRDDAIRSRIAVIHNEYGILDFQDKNYQEAESRFTLALQHNPKVAQYYLSRSRARMMMENISAARTDLLMALHLEAGNEEIPALMARLFPGKTVKDVMQSRAGAAVRTALGNLVVTAGPVKLAPMEGTGDGAEATGGESLLTKSLWKPGCFPSLRSCMEERQFHIKIASERQKMQYKLEDVMQNRQPLRHRGGRVTGLPGPVPHKPKLRADQLAVKPLTKTTGWKKFTLGIGLAAVPDNV